MRRVVLSALIICTGFPAAAATVTANVNLPRGTVIQAEDITIKPRANENHDDILQSYLGMELKRSVYEGYKLNPSYVGKPVIVRRNARVNMIYKSGILEISAWGRAMEAGGEGDVISIMNLDSRKRVQGRILPSGAVEVGL